MQRPDPAVSEEYNVRMPQKGYVYYDTVLDTIATVYEVEQDDFVTYVLEQDVDNINSDSMDKFLASLASGRFIRLGRRGEDKDRLKTDKESIDRVFRKIFGESVEENDAYDVAAAVMKEKVGEPIDFDDRE